jgi:hypothetical protein
MNMSAPIAPVKTHAKKKKNTFSSRQQGHVYIHEIEIINEMPLHMKLHAIMLHNRPFRIPDMQFVRASFITLDIYRTDLQQAAFALKEALPRFNMVEAQICVDHLKLFPDCKEHGIPRTYGELVGIELAVMKCRG